MIEREELDTERDLEDILVTMTEETNLSHSDETSVEYERLNHVPFSYRISLANPGALQKKVMVRLWLGLPSAPGSQFQHQHNEDHDDENEDDEDDGDNDDYDDDDDMIDDDDDNDDYNENDNED